MLNIYPVDPRSVEVALDIVIDLPSVAFVGMDGDALAGSGGLAWGSSRCWMWFASVAVRPSCARQVIRAAERLKRKARQLGETEVYTVRDAQFDTSERLLKLVGFVFDHEEDGHEIWRCEV